MPFDTTCKEPKWREMHLPELRVPCIQANVKVVIMEQSEESTFDSQLRICTRRERVRKRAGRKVTPSGAIIDSQSVKTTQRRRKGARSLKTKAA